MQRIFDLDQMLIRWLERLAQWYQKLTGKTNFFLAKIALILAVLAPIILWVLFGTISVLVALFISGTNYLFMRKQQFPLYLNKDLEAKVMNDAAKGLANQRKTDYSAIVERISDYSLCVLVTTLIPVFSNTADFSGVTKVCLVVELLCTIANILIACDPLPPGNSKIRGWINGIKAFFAKLATVSTSAFRSNETLFYLQRKRRTVSSS